MTDSIEILLKQLEETKKNFYVKKGKSEEITKEIYELSKKIAELEKEQEILEKVRLLLIESTKEVRIKAKSKIEKIVTCALQYIFNDNVWFEVDILDRRESVEAEFYYCFYFNGKKVRRKPKGNTAGGYIDVMSLAIKLSVLEIFPDKILGPLILDEPLKQVSKAFKKPSAEFIKYINKAFHRQIIMATHIPEFTQAANCIYKVALEGNYSKATLIGKDEIIEEYEINEKEFSNEEELL